MSRGRVLTPRQMPKNELRSRLPDSCMTKVESNTWCIHQAFLISDLLPGSTGVALGQPHLKDVTPSHKAQVSQSVWTKPLEFRMSLLANSSSLGSSNSSSHSIPRGKRWGFGSWRRLGPEQPHPHLQQPHLQLHPL